MHELQSKTFYHIMHQIQYYTGKTDCSHGHNWLWKRKVWIKPGKTNSSDVFYIMTKDGRDILNGTYLILVREWVRTGRLEVNSLQNLLEDTKKIGFHLTVLLVYLYIESGILNQVIIKFNRRVLVVKKPFCNIDKPLKICDEPQGCLWQYLLL